ncbi:MAG: P-loop ATPase [Candidatus Aenigmatarchaeota archaeon]|nr:MAG: P-loop ATPase [Candidatus Aenigmarchaeota archaeon]
MRVINILSGKGGTGKTMVSSSLLWTMSRKKRVVGIDCDVDAANLGMVLGVKITRRKEIETSEKAFLIEEKCTGCFKCVDVCNFSAIEKGDKKPVFNRFLCEGCGSCELVCPENAIEIKTVKNAWITEGASRYGFPVVSGQLKMGESGSGKIVTEVRRTGERVAKENKSEIMIIDSAAGISCPVIASVRNTDYVIAVSEPTPSGFNDLKRAIKLVEFFKIPCGLIINKFDINKELTRKIENFAKEKGISVLGRIPYHKDFVDAAVNLKPVVVYKKKYREIFENIAEKIYSWFE